MMRKEEFWAVKLSKEKPSVVWKLTDDDDSELDIVTTLLIKQACLGVTAKKDEVNVVEVCAVDYSGEDVQCPIVNLTQKGTSACAAVNATLHSPIELKLTAGSGPVHLSGCLEEVLVDLSEDEDEDDDDAEEVPMLDSRNRIGLEKRISDDANGPIAKRKKPEIVPAEEDDDDEDDDDDDDDDFIIDEADEMDEDDDDEDDDEDDDDDDEIDELDEEDEDDDDEEDDDSNDSEEVTKALTKPQKNKLTPAKATPKKNDAKATPTKTPTKNSEPVNIDELKKKLGKSPNLPKKSEKFTNFMKHNFNVTSQEIVGDLWQWVSQQASKK